MSRIVRGSFSKFGPFLGKFLPKFTSVVFREKSEKSKMAARARALILGPHPLWSYPGLGPPSGPGARRGQRAKGAQRGQRVNEKHGNLSLASQIALLYLFCKKIFT